MEEYGFTRFSDCGNHKYPDEAVKNHSLMVEIDDSLWRKH